MEEDQALELLGETFNSMLQFPEGMAVVEVKDDMIASKRKEYQ